MEKVLDVYKQPYDPQNPVICMDESPKQLIAETRIPIPDKEKALWDRFEFVYTPKHGSWLNMAEIELNVLTGQCLDRRMEDIEFVRKEVLAWEKSRNNKNAKVK